MIGAYIRTLVFEGFVNSVMSAVARSMLMCSINAHDEIKWDYHYSYICSYNNIQRIGYYVEYTEFFDASLIYGRVHKILKYKRSFSRMSDGSYIDDFEGGESFCPEPPYKLIVAIPE
jgi:hypothetical protein